MTQAMATIRDEGDLLAASNYRRPGSRLSCHLLIEPVLAGLRVMAAPVV